MKRGRKPKEKKGYFYENEEQAVMDYINSKSPEEKNKIFVSTLYPAFTKMIESIIRRYKLYVPDEEFEQTFNDTISYLLTKINNFKPIINMYEQLENPSDEVKKTATKVWDSDFDIRAEEDSPKYIKVCYFDEGDYLNPVEKVLGYYKKVKKQYKAYSYCGTVCKNYLIFKNMQFAKEQQRTTPYDTISDTFENDSRYSTEEEQFSDVAGKLIKESIKEIKNMIDNREKYSLNDDEVKVGIALCEVMNRWEELIKDDGSNKLQKSSVLYFLREETMMDTKTFRENMKKFKKAYYNLKKSLLDS